MDVSAASERSQRRPAATHSAKRLVGALALLAAGGGVLALVARLRPHEAPCEPTAGQSTEPSDAVAEPLVSSGVPARTPLLAAEHAPWTVSGVLSDERGAALPRERARIALCDEQGATHVGLARDDGRFAFQNLHAGKWRIASDDADVRGDAVDFELTADQPRAEIDLVVERGRRIDVQLVATDGRALSAVLAENGACATDLPAIAVLDPLRLFDSRTDPGERAPALGASALVPTERTLDVAAFAGGALLARVRVLAGDAAAELRVEPAALLASMATIVFAVVDEQGAPLAGASARAAPRAALPCAIPVGPDGTCEWRCLPGEASLLVHAPGRAAWRTRLQVAPGALDLGRIALEPARSVRGTVLDRDGRPCSVALRCEREESPGRWAAPWPGERVRSGPDGAFTIGELARGRHRVLAEVPGSTPTEFEVSDEAAAELRVVAGPR